MNALLIGINYIGTPNQLEGCIYDVIEIKSLIVDAYGFDPNTIVVLRDDDPSNRPTKARILQELTKLVAASDSSSNTFLHYSGHGTQITDKGNDEVDKLDECIVPCDYATAGFITDDEINAICKSLKGVGIAIFDSCRSGTVMDLPYSGVNEALSTDPPEGFYCFSGCTDNQDAVEEAMSTSGSNTGLPQGAMTMAFISTVRTMHYHPTIPALLYTIQLSLHSGGYTQTPQLTSSQPVGHSTPFPFANPNSLYYTTLSTLNQQTAINAVLQQQVTSLQQQLAILQQQLTLLPILDASAATLSVVQGQNTLLQQQVAALQQQNIALQAQVQTIPTLQGQAARAQWLEGQLGLIPPLQNQIAALMYQASQNRR